MKPGQTIETDLVAVGYQAEGITGVSREGNVST